MKNKIYQSFKKFKILYIVFSIIIAFLLIGFIYMSTSYKTMEDAKVLIEKNDNIYLNENNYYVVNPAKETNKGLIFYPGGKVEPEAYIPLAQEISNLGFKTIIVSMPFNLAIMDTDAATTVMRSHYEIKNWFLAGHSLGGSMAAKYVEIHPHKLDGLILLASYPPENIILENIPVLSITASNDKIINHDNFIKRKENLPPDTKYITIKGGNHSQFGSYGFQEGDGKATITRDEQLKIIVKHIKKFTEIKK